MKPGWLKNLAILAITISMLTACGGPSIKVDLSSTPNLNLNANSEPLPVVVRIYQLSDRSSFETTSFADIWKQDMAVLGNSMLTRNEVILNPASENELEFDRHKQAKYVGVVAIFRDPVERKWRDVYELSTSWMGKRFSSSFSVNLAGNTLHITD